MTEALKPCPLCGFKDTKIEEGVGHFWGECPADDFMDDDDFAERGCGITGPIAPTYDEAIAAWNRRAPVTVSEAAGVQSVASALESWATALRAGRSVEPSIVGLTDMARALRALAGRNG